VRIGELDRGPARTTSGAAGAEEEPAAADEDEPAGAALEDPETE
jgi:hypothetical protein